MTPAFLHLHLTDEDRRRIVIRRAKAQGFKTVDRMGQAWTGWRGQEPRPVMRRRDLLVIGSWHAHDPGIDIADLEHLITRGWGRYAGLRRDPDGRVLEALRDPSGAMEVACWTSDAAQIVASGTPDWLWSLLPAPVKVDWPGVAGLIDDPLAIVARPPIQGVSILEAGEGLNLESSVYRQFWSPASLVRSAPRRPGSPSQLVALLDRCMAALSRDDGAEAVEVSGGLDSAIVASALAAAGRRPVALTLWHGAPGADERRYARSVTEALGLVSDIRERTLSPPSREDLLALAGDVRPAVGRADSGFDIALAAMLRDHDVVRQFTGKGGDAVFLQNWGADLLGDHFRRWGLLGALSPLPYRLARLSRRSIAALLNEALGPAGGTRPQSATISRPAEGPKRSHPWLDGAEGLPPAKRRQLRALASNLAYAAASRRSETTDVIHPLMSQPVVEWALRTPTPVLMNGGRDRSFARTAFSQRLPRAVIDRQSKGEHANIQGPELAEALPQLRDHLLDGELMRRGLIDPAALTPLLDRDQLAWRGGASVLVRVAMVESWARRWAARERDGAIPGRHPRNRGFAGEHRTGSPVKPEGDPRPGRRPDERDG